MIRYELFSLLHNKRKLLVILFFISVVCLDAYLVYNNSFLHEYHLNPNYDLQMVFENTYTPSSAAFLSGASRGHIPQEIIVWLLPLYFLFICGDSHLFELKYNYYQLLEVREKKNKIYICKLLSSFIIGFVVSFIALVLNYIICLFVFKDGLMQKISAPDVLSILSSNNPILAYSTYIIIFSFISGMVSAATTALSFLVQYKIPLYAISFGAWYAMIVSKYSITYLVQPFIEYGLHYMKRSFLIFICVTILPIIVGYIKKKTL